MSLYKKVISVLLCVIIFTSAFSGCSLLNLSNEPTTQPTTVVSQPVSLEKVGYTMAYLRTDSLNPYKCESEVNRNISGLLFDPLFNVKNDFSVTGVIAESYTYTKDNVITAKLRSGLTFTDGSALTADDVVYSFVLAKNSNYYSPSLKNIIDASADGGGNVIFTLKNADPYDVANLTFPIIKKDSDKDTSSSDDYSSAIPIGSGRYIFNEEKEEKKLIANGTRLGSFIPKYKFIGLRDITEESSIQSLFDLNEIDFYTESFSEGTYKRYSGKSSTFDTTNFVYIGVNSDCNVLKESAVRRAISLLVDRENIASVSFSGFAIPTSTPFHPSFYGTKNCSVLPIKSDKDAAISLLEDAGFYNINSSGVRYSHEDGKLEIRLLVNKENSFKLAMARHIQQTLAEADINVILKEYSYNYYIQAVKDGSYDLYIGEVNLSDSFNLNGFFTESGSYSFGIDPESKSASDYKSLLIGDKTMQEFLDTFADELPFIPVLYRRGTTVRGEKIKTESKTIVSDYFYNIHEWTAE